MNKNFILKFAIMVTLFSLAFMPSLIFADDPNYLINGALKAVKSFSIGIAVILPLAAALAIGYQQVMKMFDEDDMISIRNKKTKGILKAVVIGETASAFVALIAGFFK